MKILHLSVSDKEGAFEATHRLHQAFQNFGHQSVMIVQKKNSSNKDILQYQSLTALRKIWHWFVDKVVKWEGDYYFFNTCEFVSFSNAKSILKLLPFTPDIVMVHWVSRFINTKTIYEIQKMTHAKIVWHLLDMAPMTGGCHYAWQCRGYQKHCGNCPAIRSQSSHDLSSINFSVKQKYLEMIRPIIIAPSSELYDQCKKSALFKNNPIHKILLPLDLKKFYPGHKRELRIRHNIPIFKKVICFRSDVPNQKRKGFEYILKSLSRIDKRYINNIHLAIIGRISESDRKKIIFPYTVFSSLKSNIKLGDVYRLSDIFLCASIQDSGPMMINEAISSGLPVISFPVGVTKDLVIEGKTGFIARMKDPIDLANKINILLSMDTSSYKKMAKSCRQLAAEKLDLSVVVKQYEQIL